MNEREIKIAILYFVIGIMAGATIEILIWG